jgi:hypothetical protein
VLPRQTLLAPLLFVAHLSIAVGRRRIPSGTMPTAL